MKRLDWTSTPIAPGLVARELRRPASAASQQVSATVAGILADVRARGDEAVRGLTARLDGVDLPSTVVPQAAIDAAVAGLDPALLQAIDDAAARIEAFHAPGGMSPYAVETAPGVVCERIVRPIEQVGLYVPAGSAPLPSTVLMLGIPARLAGCPGVVLCTPPRPDGTVDPTVLSAARRCGITQVRAVGGAQAIAAMAYGTAEVPRCDKIYGPGNAWVTEAKRQVSADVDGPGIDLPAGPSEVMVVADAFASPRHVAADLLSQAEHGPDSQVVLVTDDPGQLAAVQEAVAAQLALLPRREIAAQALEASRLVLVADLTAALEVANAYGPEHLILAVREARRWLADVRCAGSVFLGPWAPEALGDYCSGTNHVLPTSGAARFTGGVSVASYQRAITVQEVSAAGLQAIGPCAVELAAAEGLDAHLRAVSLRLDDLAGALPAREGAGAGASV